MGTARALLFTNIIAIATTLASCSSNFTFTVQRGSSALEESLQPEDFERQNVSPDGTNTFPSITTQGEFVLTRDPTGSGDRRASPTLYNVGRITHNRSQLIRNEWKQVLSFETSFRFNITTFTKYNESGDGIAFVITTDEKPHKNSTGRFLGLMPEKLKDRHQQFMAIEFDTFQNLQEEILDPSASHIGIDITSLKSIAFHDTKDSSDPLYLYSNYTITAWVRYNASTHLIQVWATNGTQRQQDPILSHPGPNLSQLFEHYNDIYACITAASGNNSEFIILYSWNLTIFEEKQNSHLSITWILIIVLASIIVLSVAFAMAILAIHRRRKLAVREQSRRAAIEVASVSVHQYGYNELKRASQNFSEEQRIGKGGFSSVYKGIIRDGTVVAIKKMKDGLVDAEVIAREVRIISKVKHRHLLELEGWCYERGEALLVYKYMPKGSLDSYLYGEKRRSGERLDSETRFKIIVGVAAGLDYLHRGLDECVVHRDVKAANVLLTEMMDAKLGDFGLARLIAHDASVTITTAGTIGYMAPEITTGRVTEKSDVYSFGVLILEVACGRKALTQSVGSTYTRLVDWVWLHNQKATILDALDPSIVHTLPLEDVGAVTENEELRKWICVLHLGLLCCQADPDMRPFMREVHQTLKDCIVLPPPDSWSLYSVPSCGLYSAQSSRKDTEVATTSGAASSSSLRVSISELSS